MSVRIGVGVGADHLRAVAVRGGRIIAATEVARDPSVPLAAALAELLGAAPLPRFPRPRVCAAFGPALAQTKRIAGLPPLTDARLLRQLVREGAGKFFLRGSVPLAVSGARTDGPGAVWAAALDERVLREVEDGCRRAGLALEAAVPAAVVLPRVLRADRLVWRDGNAALELSAENGELSAVRRAPDAVGGAEETEADPVAPLATLGDQAWRFADAYGAAVLPANEAVAVRPGHDAAGGAPVPGWRMALAGGAVAVAALLAVFGPPLAALRAEEDAVAALALQADPRAEASAVRRELDRADAALAEIAAFDSARYSPTLLLRDLSAALPRGAALVTFRADTAGGSLVALAPRASAVLTPLERVSGIGAVEIVGPVTRETVGGQELERVSLRFRVDAVVRARAGRIPAAPADSAAAPAASPGTTTDPAPAPPPPDLMAVPTIPNPPPTGP